MDICTSVAPVAVDPVNRAIAVVLATAALIRAVVVGELSTIPELAQSAADLPARLGIRP
jgi:hypothetical protein